MSTSQDVGEQYAVIELVKGPTWTPGVSVRLVALQLRHMRTLWRLRSKGLVLMASPVSGMEPIRGLVVVRRRDVATVMMALSRDEAVRLGRLSVRIATSE